MDFSHHKINICPARSRLNGLIAELDPYPSSKFKARVRLELDNFGPVPALLFCFIWSDVDDTHTGFLEKERSAVKTLQNLTLGVSMDEKKIGRFCQRFTERNESSSRLESAMIQYSKDLLVKYVHLWYFILTKWQAFDISMNLLIEC